MLPGRLLACRLRGRRSLRGDAGPRAQHHPEVPGHQLAQPRHPEQVPGRRAAGSAAAARAPRGPAGAASHAQPVATEAGNIDSPYRSWAGARACARTGGRPGARRGSATARSRGHPRDPARWCTTARPARRAGRPARSGRRSPPGRARARAGCGEGHVDRAVGERRLLGEADDGAGRSRVRAADLVQAASTSTVRAPAATERLASRSPARRRSRRPPGRRRSSGAAHRAQTASSAIKRVEALRVALLGQERAEQPHRPAQIRRRSRRGSTEARRQIRLRHAPNASLIRSWRPGRESQEESLEAATAAHDRVTWSC